MNQQEAIREMKIICIDIAANLEVPPALVEIILIKALSENKETNLTIPDYLKDGHLSRLLVNWKGKFEPRIKENQVSLLFSDGTIVGSRKSHALQKTVGWSELTRLLQLEDTPDLYKQISAGLTYSLKSKIPGIFPAL